MLINFLFSANELDYPFYGLMAGVSEVPLAMLILINMLNCISNALKAMNNNTYARAV